MTDQRAREECAAGVMVIDDEPMVRRVLERMLSRLGYETFAADGGPQGLAMAREHQNAIGLVILDMTMPGMSGFEVKRALRDQFPQLPILLASGYTDRDGELESLLDEHCSFMQKPFRLPDLAAQVKAMLRASDPHGAAG